MDERLTLYSVIFMKCLTMIETDNVTSINDL